jgi:hypothetical protein
LRESDQPDNLVSLRDSRIAPLDPEDVSCNSSTASHSPLMNSAVTHSSTPASQTVRAPMAVTGAPQAAISVVTRAIFIASPEAVWKALMFYEQIDQRPPLLLRLLLPIPLRTEGRKSQVGDEVKCQYLTGHLLKRVTGISPGVNYEFEVVEQTLKLGRGIKLVRGSYALRSLAHCRTEVALMTQYSSRNRPRWLCRRIEAAVCHCFHRHILSAMRSDLDSN